MTAADGLGRAAGVLTGCCVLFPVMQVKCSAMSTQRERKGEEKKNCQRVLRKCVVVHTSRPPPPGSPRVGEWERGKKKLIRMEFGGFSYWLECGLGVTRGGGVGVTLILLRSILTALMYLNGPKKRSRGKKEGSEIVRGSEILRRNN